MISEYTVPWLAVENRNARSLALKWMKSRNENVAACGWCTYIGIIATTEDEDLELGEVKELLVKIVDDIDGAKGRVRYTMNSFVIAVGTHIKPLLSQAKKSPRSSGKSMSTWAILRAKSHWPPSTLPRLRAWAALARNEKRSAADSSTEAE